MGIACSNASSQTTRSVVSRRQQIEAFSHLYSYTVLAMEKNKIAKYYYEIT